MKLFRTVTIISLMVLILGCDQEERYMLRFDHNMHVEEMELECSDCHGDLEAGRFSRADHDSCVDCHEDLIDADEIAEDTCGTCHVEKDLETIGEVEYESPSRGVFKHTEALGNKCDFCHSKTLQEGVEHVKAASRSDVLGRRKKAHESGMDCSSCHDDLNSDTEPLDHSQNWTRRHGTFSADEDAVCTVCHTANSCKACHQNQQPSSHNNLFRTRTHGIEASWDRGKCMTCHKQDSCESCHSNTRPRSHSANWQQRHCSQCHSSSGVNITGSGCATCHPKGVQSHEDIAPPSWHEGFPGSSCLISGCHNPVDGNPSVRLVPSKASIPG